MIDKIKPGNILATRNTDEVGNESPGWWNHLAIVSINGWVVEAQKEPNAIIAVPIVSFLERYPEILAFNVVEEKYREEVAAEAVSFVGLPYRKVASLFPRWRRPFLGENCVSVVRKTVAKVTGRDPGWRRPDHAVNSSIQTVGHKVDYVEWEKPTKWFDRMTLDSWDLYQTVWGKEGTIC